MTAGGKEKGRTIEQATVEYLEGKLSQKEYVQTIKKNPERPNYRKLVEHAAKNELR